MTPAPYVKAKDVATFLNISERTVWRWTHEEFIPSYKIKGTRRFRLEEVQNWIRKGAEEGRTTRIPPMTY